MIATGGNSYPLTKQNSKCVICTSMDLNQLPFIDRNLNIQITIAVYLGLTPQLVVVAYVAKKWF